MYRVTLTHHALRRISDILLAERPLLRMPAGLNRMTDWTEWLVHAHTPVPGPQAERTPQVLVVRSDDPAVLAGAARLALDVVPLAAPWAILGMGVGPAAGHVTGLVSTPNGVGPLDVLAVTAPGLPHVELRSRPAASEPTDLWSRTAGALGEAAWHRLRQLHVAVVGCGRSGILVLTTLSRLGVRTTAIDADQVERHNLGEMPGLTLADLGRPKTEAARAALTPPDQDPVFAVTSLPVSVLTLSALSAVKRADVLVCCVDNGAARLATAVLAAAYCKPLLDLGTGIFHAPAEVAARGPFPRRMGADVRLVLPGQCLVCMGGINALQQARAELLASTRPLAGAEDWQRERAGSLLSLNGVAVHLGLRLLEDLVAGRVGSSVWLHLEYDQAGIPHLESRGSAVRPACPLCVATARGDDAVRQFREILDHL